MNYELLWFQLKKHIQIKNSHGKNEILNKMMDMEIEASTTVLKINPKSAFTPIRNNNN